MSARQVVLTAAGNSTTIQIDPKQFKYGVGLLVNYASNTTGGCTVFVSGDDPTAPTGAWNPHDVLKNLTASQNSSLAYPCSMVRLTVDSITSNNNATPRISLSVVQAG